MSRGQVPRLRYPIFGGVGLIALLAWLAEQFLATKQWWSVLPWGWLTLLMLAVVVGQLITDWSNDRSWLRQKWRKYWRLFDLVEVRYIYREKEAKSVIVAQIAFRKHISSGSILIKEFWPMSHPFAKGMSHVHKTGERFVMGHHEDIELAHIPDASDEHSVWLDGMTNFRVDGGCLVLITVSDGQRDQTEKFYLEQPPTRGGAQYDRLVIMLEGAEVFRVPEH